MLSVRNSEFLWSTASVTKVYRLDDLHCCAHSKLQNSSSTDASIAAQNKYRTGVLLLLNSSHSHDRIIQ